MITKSRSVFGSGPTLLCWHPLQTGLALSVLLVLSVESTSVHAQLPNPAQIDPTNPDSILRRGLRQMDEWRIDEIAHVAGGNFEVTIRNPTDSLVRYSINGERRLPQIAGTQITYRGIGRAEIRFDRGLRDGSFFAYNLPSGNTYTFQWVKRDLPEVGLVTMLELFKNVPEHDPSIHVRFTNATLRPVFFHLNGGDGLNADLDPGESARFTMAVDRNVTPAVFIRQPNGGELSFSVANHGDYVFRRDGDAIRNFYHQPEHARFPYTITNASGREVSFRVGGREHTLPPGHVHSASFDGDKAKARIFVLSTGKGYQLRGGNHKLWWMTQEQRIGLDLDGK